MCVLCVCGHVCACMCVLYVKKVISVLVFLLTCMLLVQPVFSHIVHGDVINVTWSEMFLNECNQCITLAFFLR